ncbi:unnamed protein product [Sphagnum balticum]
MNLRVAYVAQHSFHHIEKHLDDTPVDYIKWRFAGQTTRDPNKYIPLEKMVELGLAKLVKQTDDRVGMLSGGQKVKLVLAAAMWNKPHVIVLDEPTNYLGGVVIISHNSEFTSALCTETWLVKDGTCYTQGKTSSSDEYHLGWEHPSMLVYAWEIRQCQKKCTRYQDTPSHRIQIIVYCLADYDGDICVVYVDDIGIAGETWEEFLVNLDKVLTRLSEFDEMEYLGIVCTSSGIV